MKACGFASLFPSQGYEVLLDEEERKEQNFCFRARWSVATIVVLVWLGWTSQSTPSTRATKDEHTLPTLLSVVHHKTDKYVFALESELYEQLKRATFIRHEDKIAASESSMKESPTLSVDRFAMGLRDPLTLSWTPGKDHSGKEILKDSDVVALYCGNQIYESDIYEHPERFLDAATIAQARATHRKHNHIVDLSENQWRFPSFPVLRKDVCIFALYQARSDGTFALLDTSDAVQIDSTRTTPTAIHLALSNEPTEMVVQFITGDEAGTPVAQYFEEGKEKNTRKATGTTRTYTADDMCEAPANITEAGKFQPPGMLHVVRLTDLEPNTNYQYKVGLAHGQGITWSDSFSFRSAPIPGDPEPHAFIVYGDQGCPSNGWGSGGTWTAAMTTREVLSPNETLPIRAVHHFGDLSYAKGAAHIWDEWFNMISSFTTKVPLMVGVGNHEYDHLLGWEEGKDPSGVVEPYQPLWANYRNDSGGECAVPTVNHFTMPNSTGSNLVFWYAFDFGNVHTIVLSMEHDISPGSRQYEWFEAELSSVDRTLTPWLIVECHRPLYDAEANAWDDNAVGITHRYYIEDLLYDYKVDMVLAGHYHSYFRTCDGLYGSRCNKGGPIHITVGTAGAALADRDLYSNHWTAKHIKQEYGYGRITVANATALRFQFVKAGDINDTSAGEIHDDVWILRDR